MISMSKLSAEQRTHFAEMARRELARRELLDFARYMVPGYQVGDHHRVLAKALHAVQSGELRRLIVNMPPRHGKSMLVSQLFPCWALGKKPELEIVQSGYAEKIALEHSRKARDFFVKPEYRNIFPEVRHAPGRRSQEAVVTERQAAHEWGTKQGGRYYAVGVGGGLTGRGADIAIIDDPVKDRASAMSETVRTGILDWYRSTLRTRLSPEGCIILVMTRWHPDDLAGSLITEMKADGEEWEVIKFKAIDDDGAALWPERWPVETMLQTQKAVGSYEWSALYQQEPTLRQGNLFRVELIDFTELANAPAIRWVRCWDLASTTKQRAKDDPDFTVGALVGVVKEGIVPHIWVRDLVYGQWEGGQRDQMIRATAERDGAGVAICIEGVAGYKDAADAIQKALRGLRVVHRVTPVTDKVTRAATVEACIEAGNLHVVKAPWNDFFLRHFTEFPSGTHDDAVDAVSGGVNFLYNPNVPLLV